MRKLILLSLLLFLCGCSYKISKHFEQNEYTSSYNIHVVNDSLQMYFKSPADITYSNDSKGLRKVIRKSNIKIKDSILVYGITNDPPYEYYVTVSSNHEQSYPENLVLFDTLIDNQTIRFIGNPLIESSREILRLDLKSIFESLEIGPDYRSEINTIMDIVIKYQNSNKFYAALSEINEFSTYDTQEEWAKFQMELTYSSFLGENSYYDESLQRLMSSFIPSERISEILKKHLQIDSTVIEVIVNEAKTHKIVMINENHYYPNHRILVIDLLQRFKEIGYTHLALEALNYGQDSLLNLDDSYPTLETGFYTNEQNFGNLIRKAKDLGFEFVAYENNDNNKNRELGQAENIYNKTFKIDAKSKVLLLGGIDHILEEPTKEGQKWMATIFKEKYNIDPLTISQTHLNSYKNEMNVNYGILNSDYFENHRLNSVDFLVLNNMKAIRNIETTTFSYKNNYKLDLQIALFYDNEISNKHDHHNRVPYYTTILNSGEKCNLPLRTNKKTHLYTFDKNGRTIDYQIIEIRK